MQDSKILVKKMRDAQKEFERSKSSIAQKAKIKLEKEVDAGIMEVENQLRLI